HPPTPAPMSCVDAHSRMRIGAGCPLTPEAPGRWRSYISRALGAASGPFTVALSTRIRFASCPCGSCGQPATLAHDRCRGGRMLEETHDTEEIIQRVAALDIGKAELGCCVGGPSRDTQGEGVKEIQPYQTMTRSLLVLADRLRQLGVTRVVMVATSDY